MGITRRNLLRSFWKIGGGLLTIVAGWTSWEMLRPLTGAGVKGKLKLGSPSKFSIGTATFVNQGRLWVTNAEGQFFALSQKCPHLGCRTPFCESSGRFECPCHGSVFNIAGEWISGPSPRGMDQYSLAIEDDVVVVDTSKLTNGPDRGAADFLTDPKGPACVGTE